MTPRAPSTPNATADRHSLFAAIRDLIRLLAHVHGGARRLLAWAILATIMAAAADIASLVLLHRTAMALTGMAASGGSASAGGPIAFLSAMLVGSAMRLWAQRLTTAAQFGITEALSAAAFRNLQYQSYADYIAHGASEGFVAIDRLQIVCFSALAPFIAGVAALTTTSVMIVTIAALYPVLIVPIGLAAVALGTWLHLGRRRTVTGGGTSRLALLRARLLVDARTAFRDVYLINGQSRMVADFCDVEHRLRDRQARIALGAQSSRYPFEILVVALVIAFLLLAPGSTTTYLRAIPTLGIVGLAALRMMPSLATLRSATRMIGQHGDVIGDALALLQRGGPPLAVAADVPVLRHDIVLRDIGMVRPDRLPILDALDLRIPRGARIGIVGESGSGKSTLLDLICGVVAPSHGAVLIDGVPLDVTHGAARGAAWRERIGVVSQNPILLGTDLREIVSYPQHPAEADRQRFDTAIALSGVAAMAEGFPDGLDTIAGEALSRLSGGQRQRLALAHALYRARDLLLLDEATGQLDIDSEQAVVSAIESLPRDMAIIVVTHRPALLACCDVIYALTGGRLEPIVAQPQPARDA